MSPPASILVGRAHANMRRISRGASDTYPISACSSAPKTWPADPLSADSAVEAIMSKNTARHVGERMLSPEVIAVRAYIKWIERGRPLGDGLEDWFAARAELEGETQPRSTRKRNRGRV
jgi:hypothetical protein